jgi:hypothetical protein
MSHNQQIQIFAKNLGKLAMSDFSFGKTRFG